MCQELGAEGGLGSIGHLQIRTWAVEKTGGDSNLGTKCMAKGDWTRKGEGWWAKTVAARAKKTGISRKAITTLRQPVIRGSGGQG